MTLKDNNTIYIYIYIYIYTYIHVKFYTHIFVLVTASHQQFAERILEVPLGCSRGGAAPALVLGQGRGDGRELGGKRPANGGKIDKIIKIK